MFLVLCRKLGPATVKLITAVHLGGIFSSGRMLIMMLVEKSNVAEVISSFLSLRFAPSEMEYA